MPLVCKRWRAASLACPALWTTCDFELFLNDAGISRLRGFRHWVAPRAAHLRSLRFCCMGTGLAEEQEELQSQVGPELGAGSCCPGCAAYPVPQCLQYQHWKL